MQLKSHPYADLFPMMTEAELEALADDIKENGLRHPVVRYQGQILDGRNRLLACKKAEVEPTFTEHEGDDASALALVISLNAQRRDLTAGQRAITAARVWATNGEHKPGPKSVKSLPNSMDLIAKQFKTSKPSVIQARDLLRDAPDLAEQVSDCTLSLAAAHEKLQCRARETAQKARDARRIAEFADAVSSGEMSFEQALQTAIEKERAENNTRDAEADARRNWLKEYAQLLTWIETFVAQRPDDYLAWYTQPDSPGLFDHGITAERIKAAIAQLQRTATITFRRGHG